MYNDSPLLVFNNTTLDSINALQALKWWHVIWIFLKLYYDMLSSLYQLSLSLKILISKYDNLLRTMWFCCYKAKICQLRARKALSSLTLYSDSALLVLNWGIIGINTSQSILGASSERVKIFLPVSFHLSPRTEAKLLTAYQRDCRVPSSSIMHSVHLGRGNPCIYPPNVNLTLNLLAWTVITLIVIYALFDHMRSVCMKRICSVALCLVAYHMARCDSKLAIVPTLMGRWTDKLPTHVCLLSVIFKC